MRIINTWCVPFSAIKVYKIAKKIQEYGVVQPQISDQNSFLAMPI